MKSTLIVQTTHNDPLQEFLVPALTAGGFLHRVLASTNNETDHGTLEQQLEEAHLGALTSLPHGTVAITAGSLPTLLGYAKRMPGLESDFDPCIVLATGVGDALHSAVEVAKELAAAGFPAARIVCAQYEHAIEEHTSKEIPLPSNIRTIFLDRSAILRFSDAGLQIEAVLAARTDHQAEYQKERERGDRHKQLRTAAQRWLAQRVLLGMRPAIDALIRDLKIV